MSSGVEQCGPVDPDVARCLDDEGRIAIDLPCARCRYNLRSRGLDDDCPECGTAVGESLKPGLLMFAGPGRVRRLQVGAWLVAVSLVLSLFAYVIILMLDYVSPMSSGDSMMKLWSAADLLQNPVAVIGVLWLTAVIPGMEGTERWFSARRLARRGLVAMLAISIIASLDLLLFGILPYLMEDADSYRWCAERTFGLLGFLGMAKYSAHLARRLPDDHLAQRARFVSIMWAITMALSLASSISGMYMYYGCFEPADFQRIQESAWWLVWGIFAWVERGLGFAFTIWGVILLVHFSRRLTPIQRVAAKARGIA